MTNPSNERISALMDGELDSQVSSGAVDALLENVETRDTWARYHLISDTLRQHMPEGIDAQFSSKVMAALEDEPTILAPPVVKPSPIARRLTGFAVAASVAAVAVMGVQTMYQQDTQVPGALSPTAEVAQLPSTLLPAVSPAMSSPSRNQTFARAVVRQSVRQSVRPNILPNVQTVTQSSSTLTRPSSLVKRVHPNLNKYLVGHNQQTTRPVVQGVMPYARIVAYPNSRHFIASAQK